MGIFDRFESATTKSKSSRRINPMGGASRFLSFGTQVQHLDQYQHFTGYTYSIIRTIANRVCGQPLKHGTVAKDPKQAARDKSKNPHRFPTKHFVPSQLKSTAEQGRIRLYEEEESDILKAFKNPNPAMVRHNLMYVTIASLKLTGIGVWWMTRNPENDAPEIWYLAAHWVQPVHTDEKLFSHWRVTIGGETHEVPNEEIVFFYYPDPAKPFEAYAPLTALSRAVLTDESLEESQRRSLLNSASPALAITVGAPPEMSGSGQPMNMVLSGDQRKALRTLIREEYRGVLNNGEPMILDGFIKDVKNLIMSPRELDFNNSSQATRGRLAQGFGVNPISMGETENANRASSAVADDHLIDNVINPLIAMLSEVMTRQMPKFFKGGDGESEVVYLEPAMSHDAEYELEVEQAMIDRGAMSINEMRARHHLPNLTNGNRALVQGVWEDIVTESIASEKSVERTGPRTVKRIWRTAPGTIAGGLGINGVHKMYDNLNDKYEARLKHMLSKTLLNLGEIASASLDSMHDGTHVDQIGSCVDHIQWVQEIKKACTPVLMSAALAGAHAEWMLAGKQRAFQKSSYGVINLPQVTQEYDYDCGAAAVMSICEYFEVGDNSLEQYRRSLRTSPESGTTPENILHYLNSVGLTTVEHEGFGLDDLIAIVESGHPVLCPVQDYGGLQDISMLEAGHWVVVTGANAETITLMDPWAGIVETDPETFMELWKDDEDGEGGEPPLIRYGIAVGTTSKSFRYTFIKAVEGQTPRRAPTRIEQSVVKYVNEVMQKPFWGKIVRTVVNKIKSVFTTTKKEDNPIAEVKKVLTDELEIGSKASDVATVEISSAIGGGQHIASQALERQGVIKGRMWVTRRDGRVRHTHVRCDRQVVHGEENFVVNGYPARFPADPNLPAGERCGCRCIVVSVVNLNTI